MPVADEREEMGHALAEAIEIIEQLDSENEHLRQRLNQTLIWWEDDAWSYTERERDLETQIENLEREITALNSTLTMRIGGPFRRVAVMARRLKVRRR